MLYSISRDAREYYEERLIRRTSRVCTEFQEIVSNNGIRNVIEFVVFSLIHLILKLAACLLDNFQVNNVLTQVTTYN